MSKELSPEICDAIRYCKINLSIVSDSMETIFRWLNSLRPDIQNRRKSLDWQSQSDAQQCAIICMSLDLTSLANKVRADINKMKTIEGILDAIGPDPGKHAALIAAAVKHMDAIHEVPGEYWRAGGDGYGPGLVSWVQHFARGILHWTTKDMSYIDMKRYEEQRAMDDDVGTLNQMTMSWDDAVKLLAQVQTCMKRLAAHIQSHVYLAESQ
jgi:hypothetical protein